MKHLAQSSHPHPLLPLSKQCLIGTCLKRVKRFSVLCRVQGQEVWAHTNNSGSMLGLIRPGNHIVLSPAANPARKLAYTLEMIGLPSSGGGPLWVGVNTLSPNRLLRAAFTAGCLPWAKGYTRFTAEAKRGTSRLDALLEGDGLPPLWVECKNVTLVEDGAAAFPDAVTERGQKHIQAMMDIIRQGERAAFFYCIQRVDAACFMPASYVDPKYAELFYDSISLGVAVYPYMVNVSPQGLDLGDCLPIVPREQAL